MSRIERVEGVAMAAVLGIVPLLPRGLRYLGLNADNLVDVAVVAMLVVWIVGGLVRHRHVSTRSGLGGAAAIRGVWIVWLAVAAGATMVGLAAENRIGSRVFAAYLPSLISEVLRPSEFTSAPFYPARMFVTLFEGALVFGIVWRCCARAGDSRPFVRTLSWGWLSGLGLVSAIAIVQYFTRFQLEPEFVLRNPDLTRASATFDDPNAFGSYLLLGIGLGIGVALRERRGTRVGAAVIVTGLAIVALVATVSRTALAAFPLAAFLVAAFAPIRPEHFPELRVEPLRYVARLLLLVTVAVVAVVLVARVVLPDRTVTRPASFYEAIAQTFDPQVPLENVLNNRQAYWRAALRMSREHPVTGNGAGRYPRLLPQFRDDWIPLDNAHSFILQLLAEMGILGAVAFIALVVVSIAILRRAVLGAEREHAATALGALFGAVAYSITLLFGHPLLLPSGQILWASVLALGVIGSAPRVERSSPDRSRIRVLTTLAAIACFGMYVAAAWQTQPPPRPSDPWGYSWSLFPEEWGYFPKTFGVPREDYPMVPGPAGTEAARFRWTGERALIELQAPQGAHHCSFLLTAFLPSRGISQRVRASFGGRQHVVQLDTSEPYTLHIPLADGVLDEKRRMLIRLEVAPPFAPADIGVSADRRRLGIQLFKPRCGNG
jgi:O-antigen ligase